MSWMLTELKDHIGKRDLPAIKRLLKHSLSERYWETRLGINTRTWMTQEELGTDPKTCAIYAPTSYVILNSVIPRIAPKSIDENKILLDVGAGMGRSSLLAATYPFKAIIGLEYSPDLVARARENYNRARSRLTCKNVEYIAADAAQFKIPDDVTTLYLYAPFHGKTVDEFAMRIRETMERRPRRIDIAYVCNLTIPYDFEVYPWIRTNERYMSGAAQDDRREVCLADVVLPDPSRLS